MVFNIEKLASSLCLAYGTDQGITDVLPECFDLMDTDCDVWEVVNKIEIIFNHDFEPIVKELIKYQNEDYEDYMRAVLSRYVRVSEQPTYFHFLLLCSLSYRIVLDTFFDHKCYTLAKIVSLCLIAVYDRYYKDFFDKYGQSETLTDYCKKISPHLLSEDGKVELPPDVRQEMSSLISSMIEVGCTNFNLTEKELDMINEMTDLVQNEERAISEPSTDDSNMEIEMSSLTLNEHSSVANAVCDFCESKCIEFLLIFESESEDMIFD